MSRVLQYVGFNISSTLYDATPNISRLRHGTRDAQWSADEGVLRMHLRLVHFLFHSGLHHLKEILADKASCVNFQGSSGQLSLPLLSVGRILISKGQFSASKIMSRMLVMMLLILMI